MNVRVAHEVLDHEAAADHRGYADRGVERVDLKKKREDTCAGKPAVHPPIQIAGEHCLVSLPPWHNFLTLVRPIAQGTSLMLTRGEAERTRNSQSVEALQRRSRRGLQLEG